jgi:hypothetical protein
MKTERKEARESLFPFSERAFILDYSTIALFCWKDSLTPIDSILGANPCAFI